MKSKFNIRTAGPEDAAIIAELCVEFEKFFQALVGKKKSPSFKSYERQVRRSLSGPQPYAHTILLEQKGNAIGHATYNYYYATAHNCRGLYVQDLFVRKEARAGGAGKALMDALKRIAKEEGCGVLELAVWNLNPKALGFYLAQGGKPVDEDILMQWKLKRA